MYANRSYWTTITLGIGLLLLGSSYAFVQTANATSTTTTGVSTPFAFVYKTSGGIPHPLEQRTLYNSLTKELAFVGQWPFPPGGIVDSIIKVITLNNTLQNKLEQEIKNNNIFATDAIYYTHILDLPVHELSVILGGRGHTVTWNVWRSSVPEKPVPEGLLEVIETIQNITSSK